MAECFACGVWLIGLADLLDVTCALPKLACGLLGYLASDQFHQIVRISRPLYRDIRESAVDSMEVVGR